MQTSSWASLRCDCTASSPPARLDAAAACFSLSPPHTRPKMAFSPRARPDTVHLAFSDADLTDTYRDERSSAAASSPRARHPRGDTPLSRGRGNADDTGTSPGRWSVSRRSASDAADEDQGDDLRELSNLDKLLNLLDGDEQDDTWDASFRHGGGLSRSVGMSTPPPPTGQHSTSHPPPAPSTVRRRDVSAARPSPSSRRPAQYPTTETAFSTAASPETASPSTRNFRPPLSARAPSALEILQRANGFSVARDGAPDSPSPRPGSVAALRRSGEGDRSGFEGSSTSLKGKERRYDAGERTDAAVDGSYEETVASVDSITRVAEAVRSLSRASRCSPAQDSSARASPHRRSKSSTRLSPTTRQTVVPPLACATFPPRREARHRPTTATLPHNLLRRQRHDSSDGTSLTTPMGPLGTSTCRCAGRSSCRGRESETDAYEPHQLVQELRDAQDYIAYLQNELHAINDVVVQLREKPDPACVAMASLTVPRVRADPRGRQQSPRVRVAPRPARCAGKPTLDGAGAGRADDAGGVRGRQGVSSLALARSQSADPSSSATHKQHTLAMLPSLPSSASPSGSDPSSSTAPSVLSLHRALAFTRSVDQLAHRSHDLRRDEDIFQEDNLRGVLRVVDGWAARDEASGGL